MKLKKTFITLVYLGVLTQFTLACSDFYTSHSAKIQPIKVTLLYQNASRTAVPITRQTVDYGNIKPVQSLSAETTVRGSPVRRDNVPPPAHFSQPNTATEFVPQQTTAGVSEQHLQPVTSPPPAIPLDPPAALPPPVVTTAPLATTPPAAPASPTVPPLGAIDVAVSAPPVIIDYGPTEATTPPPALSELTVSPPPVIIDHGPSRANDSATTAIPLSALAETAPPTPVQALEQQEIVPPAIIDHGPSAVQVVPTAAATTSVVALAEEAPVPPAIIDRGATVPPPESAIVAAAPTPKRSEPSITPLAKGETEAMEQEVAALLAQAEIAPLTAYIQQYELDFARYPYVQRLRVARDKRCRTAAKAFLQKGAGAFQTRFGKVCPYQTFIQAARRAK